MFLQTVAERKALGSYRRLEDVEAPIENDLPACVSYDVACMGRTGRIKSPTEFDASTGTGCRNRLQQFTLSGNVALVWACDEVDPDLVLRGVSRICFISST
ncbi:hypothetical protein STA1M1_37440 [Sinisalibacter aestuarii]|uniref:Uncharacterized protein n=1 Tax=Sinisalibacter aestuarii TaxID=2949426 RepID=A0ABQ5LZJ0_9RHOB|nr:hypothetical protein STA1M1_37440 [Sinisalibacter aestuarii]